MRDKEKKHRKGQESTIGKIIYGFLLFMPLIAIGVTCLVNTFNKEVEGTAETSQVTYKFETNEVNSITDIYNGRIYKVTINETPSTSINFLRLYAIYDISLTDLSRVDTYTNPNRFVYFQYNKGADRWYIQTINDDNTTNETVFTTLNTNVVYPVTCYVAYKAQSDAPYQYLSESDYLPVESVTTEIIATDNNSDIFYYAVDKVTQSPLFNWAQNSIIYTTTNSTCNALSITTPFIPLLLSYWLIISVIYFLYDIALMLVWLIHRKIHELQESL